MKSQLEKDKVLIQKEQELNKILNEYYNYDMSELKKDMEKVLYSESEKITKEKDDKLKEISNNFKRVLTLTKEHVSREAAFKNFDQIEDKELVVAYEKQNEKFEKSLKDTTAQRQLLRNEIASLEVELRKLRDQLSDKQFENKNLALILQKEEELNRHKTVLESKALKQLSEEISDQLSELQQNSEKITGKITPFGMETTLQDILTKIINDYEKFIAESEKDVRDTQKEVDKLRKELEKEKIISEHLQKDVDNNNNELVKMKEIFKKNKSELDEMVWKHNHRLKELEEIRTVSNDDIKRIALELGAVQSEINVLILESQKYEGYLEFLVCEREMILKAQLESDEVDPLFQGMDLLLADEKRRKIEEQILNLERDWNGRIERIREEMERILTENEMKEYRSRLAILAAELNDKNQQIEKINQDTLDLEEAGERALLIGMENSQQTTEIEVLNEKYKTALREKVDVYDEFTESLKELCNRNARFLKNMIETAKIVNETNIMKKELDQKEKGAEDIAKEIKHVTHEDLKLQEKITERIDEKQSMLRKFRTDLREKEGLVEFFEFVLKDKQKSINSLQTQFQEQGKPKPVEMQRVRRQARASVNVQQQQRQRETVDVLQTMKKQLEDVLNQLEEDRQEYDPTQAKRKRSASGQRRGQRSRSRE